MNNQKTIIHIVPGIKYGGIESFLINYFSTININKYNIHIVTYSKPTIPAISEKLTRLGIQIHEVPAARNHLINNIITLRKLFRNLKPDVVHTHKWQNGYLGLFIAATCGVKHRVMHVHESRRFKTNRQKIKCFLTKKLATINIACSEQAANYVYGPKKDVIILNNAIDYPRFQYSETKRAEQRKKLKLHKETILYGHVGRFEDEKNHRFLIQLFAAILRKAPNSKLILIGNGSLKTTIIQEIHDEKLTNNVIIIDGKENIEDYYQAMDCFIFPSKYEGFGMALIEAQANGLKCFASDAISPETSLTGRTQYLSLQLTIETWSKLIITSNKARIPLNVATPKYKKLNITNAAQKLETLYDAITTGDIKHEK